MEFSVREWTIIVGVLLIVAVFLDGYRRVRNERSNRIRVSLSKQVFNQPGGSQPIVDEPNPELPAGGARVVAKRRNDDLKLHQSVPVLIEPVTLAPEPVPEPEPQPESQPIAASQPINSALFAEDEPVEHLFAAPADDPAAYLPEDDEREEDARDEELVEAKAPVSVVESVVESAATQLRSAIKAFKREEPVAAEPEHDAPVPQEVLVVNVLCKDEAGFKGPDLLQLLLACDLRFGKLNIFHRYEKANGKGPIQFSVANLVEPGSFNLDAIDNFTTPGVSFFLTLPGPEKPVTAFNYMVETAQVLVRHLHAELRDDAHSVMTAQTIEHCRQRIRDFERKQLTLQL
jgi:cell division protein ZipA